MIITYLPKYGLFVVQKGRGIMIIIPHSINYASLPSPFFGSVRIAGRVTYGEDEMMIELNMERNDWVCSIYPIINGKFNIFRYTSYPLHVLYLV